MLRLKYFLYCFILLGAVVYVNGCADNIVTPINSQQTSETKTLLIEKQGLLDSITGTCSSFIIRTSYLDTLDFTGFEEVEITFNAYTDADLSVFNIFYVRDSAMIVSNLEGLNISNTMTLRVPSPKVRDFFQVRLRLMASLCTGQIYHLKLRDLKIYGVN